MARRIPAFPVVRRPMGRAQLGRSLMGVGAVLIACLGEVSPAAAQLELQWNAPDGCPQRAEVLTRVRALAGASLDHTEGLSSEGRITLVDGGYRLTLFLRDGPEVQERVIESASCSDLEGAAAVSLALLLGVELDRPRPDPPPPQPEPSPQQQASPQAGQPKAPPADAGRTVGVLPGGRRARDKRALAARGRAGADAQQEDKVERNDTSDALDAPAASSLLAPQDDAAATDASPTEEVTDLERWAALVQVPVLVADIGPLPRPTFGVGLGVGLIHGAWRVVGTGQLYAAQKLSAAGPLTTLGARVRQVRGSLTLCYGWQSRTLELAPCAGMALRYMSARGFGEGVSARKASGLWPAAAVGAVGSWYAMESLSLFVRVMGYVEISRPQLVIEGVGSFATLAPLSASVAVGAAWKL